MTYMLDTNMVTDIVSGRSRAAREKLKETVDQSTVVISAITQAEIRFGLENRPDAHRLLVATEDFFEAVQVLPWDAVAARASGRLRSRMTASGKSLSAMDMLIAAHALAVGAVLVTRDAAFLHTTPLLEIVDWAIDL